jgi:hypothetical protein
VTAAAVEKKEKTKKETCEAEKKKKKPEKSFPQTMDKTGVQKTLYYLSVQQVSNLCFRFRYSGCQTTPNTHSFSENSKFNLAHTVFPNVFDNGILLSSSNQYRLSIASHVCSKPILHLL